MDDPLITDEMVSRLSDAVEGECGGLAIDRDQAVAILEYVVPMIRAQAFREAAALVNEMVAGSNELRTLAAAAGDAEAVKFHAWALAAEKQVAASLTALAQKETAR